MAAAGNPSVEDLFYSPHINEYDLLSDKQPPIGPKGLNIQEHESINMYSLTKNVNTRKSVLQTKTIIISYKRLRTSNRYQTETVKEYLPLKSSTISMNDFVIHGPSKPNAAASAATTCFKVPLSNLIITYFNLTPKRFQVSIQTAKKSSRLQTS